MSEPHSEELKQEPPVKPSENQSPPSKEKGQFSARGGRGGGKPRGGAHTVKYVKKGEEEPEGEVKEPKSGKQYREKRPRAEKEREREHITLDTVIPEKPKKHEILKEPSEEEFHKKLDEIEDKITAIHEKLKKYTKEMRDTISKNKHEKNKEHYPLKDLLAAKMADHKRISEELKVLKSQSDTLRNQNEDLFDKSNKYRKNLKKYFKKEEIESELKRLIDLQKKGDITLQEEKVIIKQIAELERSLPFATPLELVEKELDEVRKEKKKLNEQMSGLYNQREALRKDIDELKADIEGRLKEKEEVLTKLDPIIESKKEDYRKEIDDLKEERRKIRIKYDEDRDHYYQQQRLLQRIEWMTKVKTRLRRDEERKKREEEEKKLEEEESKKEVEKVNPFEDEINLCDLLVNYCESLLPKSYDHDNSDLKQEALSQAVQDEWKKEKITVIASKKESDGDFFSAKNKKKNIKKKKKEEVGPEKQGLNHQFEVLGYFERLKVSPPLFVAKLADTIKEINEKKAYYQGQPLVDAKKVGEKNPESQETAEKKPEPKKAEKHQNKKGIEMDEKDFPTI